MGILPGGGKSRALGVSADGSVVVGWSESDSTTGWKAYRWTDLNGNGLLDPDERLDNHPEFDLGDLPGGGLNSLAHGVSGDGSVIVGSGNLNSDHEAFLWTQGTGMIGLGDLPGGEFFSGAQGVSADGSTVIGYSRSTLGVEPFRWTQDGGMVGLGDLPGGGFRGYAYGVSGDGSVVVGVANYDSDSEREAFRWTEDDGMVGLGDLPGGGFASSALGVSADGSVVVGSSETSTAWIGNEAFIWDENNGMRNLGDVLVNDFGLDLTGWTLRSATGISDDGLTFVGYGLNPSGYQEAWIATIPEPAIEVAVDIKPGTCPNPVNVKSTGVLPIAILGSEEFDVTDVDVASIQLAGVEPLRSGYEDVATPVSDTNDCNCITDGPDGFLDLTLKFKTQRIVEAVGDVNDGDELQLELIGVLFDETPIEGTDCILIRGRHKPINPADINKDGVVNAADFAIFAQNWLQSSIVDE